MTDRTEVSRGVKRVLPLEDHDPNGFNVMPPENHDSNKFSVVPRPEYKKG